MMQAFWSSSRIRQWWLPAFLFATFVGAQVVTLHGSGFDGLYGQDSFAYYDYAVGPLLAALRGGGGMPAFTWPPGYPLILALVSLLVGQTPLAGQLVSLTAGALVPVFTWLLAEELWGRDHPGSAVPLVAALLAGCMGQLWQSSAVVMADTTALAAATMGAWALARFGRTQGRGWLWLAAAGMAFAVLTRWAYALVALPVTAYALMVLARMARGRGWREATLAAVVAAVVVGLVLQPLWLPLRQFLAGQPGQNYLVDLDVYTWRPLNALRHQFVTADGLLQYRLPNGLYYALTPLHRYFLTPLLAGLLLPGLWRLWRERRGGRLWLLAGWWGVVLVFHAGAPWQNFRFVLAFMPPAAVVAAVGWSWVRDWLPRRWRWLAGVWLVVGLLLMGVGGGALTRGFVARKAADLRTVAWVAGEMPAQSQLLAFQLTATLQHYTRIDTTELYFTPPSALPAWLSSARPAYLLIDVANVESQWSDMTPGQTYHWLRDRGGLIPVGQRQSYTLFRVVSDSTGCNGGEFPRPEE